MIPDEAYNAGKLLDAMRPEIEKLLEEQCRPMFGKWLHSCPSQSHRAIRAREMVNERVDQLHKAGAPIDEVTPMYRIRERLEIFLAVHQAVCLLEKRYNNPEFDVFGYENIPATR